MKAMKKVFAMLLALAMIVTAVPVNSASAATYNMKAGSAGIITKTLYAGRSHTLKLNGLTASKVKSTSWSVGKTSVVKLSSKKATSAKMTCVGKGYTVVTAKVTLTNKKTKTYKAKITVKNPSLKVTPSEMTLTIGDTKPLTVEKKLPSNAKLSYVSRDPGVASVSGTQVTAKSAGETVIVTTLTCGTKKVSKETKVVVEQAEEGLTATLTNPLSSDYKTTVFVNQNAMIDVLCVRDGKPVANASVVMTIDRAASTNAALYDVENVQMITNSKGVASFVIRNTKGARITANSIGEAAFVKYNVQVQGNADSKIEGEVAFAAIGFEPIKVVRGNCRAGGTLHSGENFVSRNGQDAIINTADMADEENPNDEYVMSQQRSAESENHAVTFKGGYPYLVWPNGDIDHLDATKKVDTSAVFDSEDYHVYTGAEGDTGKTTYYYELTEDVNKLTYATMHFTDISISAETKLVMQVYPSKADAQANKNRYTIADAEVQGPSTQTSFNYQIPIAQIVNLAGDDVGGNAKLCVKVFIESKGQVNLDQNSGYKVNGVTYVYKTGVAASGGKTTPLKGAEVKWEIVDTPYTPETVLVSSSQTAAGAVTFGTYNLNIIVEKGGRLTQKLPAFPYTGTGILTKYNANGVATSWYVVETSNDGSNRNAVGEDFRNAAGGYLWTNYQAYEINEDELRDKVGKVTQSEDGTSFTVDSEMTGRSTLEGTITVNGEKIPGLDAEHSSVYTSVQWNPLPNAGTGDDSTGIVALLGQSIRVYAQLYDRDLKNRVTKAGVSVQFTSGANNTVIGANDSTVPATASLGAANAKVVNQQIPATDGAGNAIVTTDAQGRAMIELSASEIMYIKDLKAQTDTNYNVKLVVVNCSTKAEEEMKEADLYWIDADINFEASALRDNDTYSTANGNIQVPANETSPIVVNDNSKGWEYGVQSSGTNIPAGWGKLGGKYVNVIGLGIPMSKVDGGVGDLTAGTVSNSVIVKSKIAGTTQIACSIDKTSVTDGISVTNAIYVGTGETTIRKRLTLNVQWQTDGIGVSFATPNGSHILRTAGIDNTTIYVKVTDTKGNPLRDTQVYLTLRGSSQFGTVTIANQVVATDPKMPGIPTTATIANTNSNDKLVKTDANGVASVVLTEPAVATDTITIVSAKVEGVNEAKPQSYTWVDATDVLAIDQTRDSNGKFKTYYDNATGVIQLTFNAKIGNEKLIPEMIVAVYGKDKNNNHTLDVGEMETNFQIKGVEVIGNVVRMTVSNPITQIDATGLVEVEIKNDTAGQGAESSYKYTLTSENGSTYTTDPKFTIAVDATKHSGIGAGQNAIARGSADAEMDYATDEIAATAFYYGGKNVAVKGTINDGQALKAEVTWTSSNTNVVEVSSTPLLGALSAGADGYVRYKGPGIALVTAEVQVQKRTDLDNTYSNEGSTKKVFFVVTTNATGITGWQAVKNTTLNATDVEKVEKAAVEVVSGTAIAAPGKASVAVGTTTGAAISTKSGNTEILADNGAGVAKAGAGDRTTSFTVTVTVNAVKIEIKYTVVVNADGTIKSLTRDSISKPMAVS